MKPTPMSAYQSVTTTRVMPPAPQTKPPAYATRFAQHIATGKTPAQAMAIIERADGHEGKVPPSIKEDGERFKPGGVQDKLMRTLTNEWVLPCDIDIPHNRQVMLHALRELMLSGDVERRRSKPTGVSEYRLAQKDA